MKFQNFFTFTFLVCLFSSNFAFSLVVKPEKKIGPMVQDAERIFRGTVIDKTSEVDTYESGLPVHYYTFKVDDCLKGECGSQIIIKQVDMKSMPEYQVGKNYLIFLTSSDTFDAPIGLGHGVFPVVPVDGKLTIPSLKNNRALVRDTFVKSLKMSVKMESTDDYESFKSLVQEIVGGER